MRVRKYRTYDIEYTEYRREKNELLMRLMSYILKFNLILDVSFCTAAVVKCVMCVLY
jgi:hypothetical protein